VITGFLHNRVGSGWTPVDGFEEINAQAATARGDRDHGDRDHRH
jgi:hypothetical protein